MAAKITTFHETSKFWSSKYKEMLIFPLLSRDKIRPQVKYFYQKLVKERSSVVPDAYVVAGLSKGVPGDVKPVGGGEQLVGVLARLQE